jgi:3'-phosphoadenosine 5'-phosphosulfate sulfotransferase (PAPS reductase)/FAD synthetase
MKSKYKIDEPALISFSGGRTSAYMLHEILKAHNGKLPEDVHVVFANTGKEMDETLDFIHDCEEMWDVKVNWLELDIHEERPIYRNKEVNYKTASRNGEPFEALIDRKKMLPNPAMRICTAELKVSVMARFMRSKGYKEWFNVIGLRYDEPRRVSKQKNQNQANKNKWESLMPLYDNKVTAEHVGEFWQKSNFDLKLPNYNGKTIAGNCDLCYLKGTQTLVKIIKERPDLADWWIKQETKIAKAKKDYGSNYLATFKSNGQGFIDIVQIAEDNTQLDLLDDDTRSCFCHD